MFSSLLRWIMEKALMELLNTEGPTPKYILFMYAGNIYLRFITSDI